MTKTILAQSEAISQVEAKSHTLRIENFKSLVSLIAALIILMILSPVLIFPKRMLIDLVYTAFFTYRVELADHAFSAIKL